MIRKNNLEEIRDFLDRGCEFAGTQQIVDDIAADILFEMGAEYPFPDEIILNDGDDSDLGVLSDFAEKFWDKSVDMIMNVLESFEEEVL